MQISLNNEFLNQITLCLSDIEQIASLMEQEKEKEEPDYKLLSKYSQELKKLGTINILQYLPMDKIIY